MKASAVCGSIKCTKRVFCQGSRGLPSEPFSHSVRSLSPSSSRSGMRHARLAHAVFDWLAALPLHPGGGGGDGDELAAFLDRLILLADDPRTPLPLPYHPSRQ